MNNSLDAAIDPLVFEPYFRPQIWGGRRLEDMLNRRLPGPGTFGESWEISAHRHQVTRVAEGPFRGRPLDELWRERGSAICGVAEPPAEFPLLIKLLDCHELLSIQVHPTDEIANHLLGEPWGKSEAWLVLASEPSGRIYAGLKPGVGPKELERRLDDGTLADCLHAFAPKPGDAIFLRGGTVHAVGGGVLLAEVQQTSDATFRLFDWNRLGPDGKPRELHRRESLASIDWTAGPVEPLRATPLPDIALPTRGEALLRCPFFDLNRYDLGGEMSLPAARPMTIWMVIDGSAELVGGNGYSRRFELGETVLVPHRSTSLAWRPISGRAGLLEARWPGTRARE